MSTVPQSREFVIDGKTFESRLSHDASGFEIRVYHDGKPANSVTLSCAYDIADDLRQATGLDAIEELFADAEARMREIYAHGTMDR